MQSENQNNTASAVKDIAIPRELSVPIKLVEFCYGRNLTKELRLFLYLKGKTTGKLELSKADQLFADLGVKDKRTRENHINKLIDHKFAGRDNKYKILYVRSFKRVQCKTKAKHISYARVSLDTVKSRKNFKSWITATITKSINRKNGYMLRRVISGKTNKLIQPMTTPSLSYVPDKMDKGLSVRHYAKIAGVSKSKAQRDLKLAQKCSFISRQKREIPLEFYQNGKIVYQPNKFELPLVYEDFPELIGRVWMKKIPGAGKVPHIRIADIVYSTIRILNKKNYCRNK